MWVYSIRPERCRGCGACARACESKAIRQVSRTTYEIDGKSCARCGECMSACNLRAVRKTFKPF